MVNDEHIEATGKLLKGYQLQITGYDFIEVNNTTYLVIEVPNTFTLQHADTGMVSINGVLTLKNIGTGNISLIVLTNNKKVGTIQIIPKEPVKINIEPNVSTNIVAEYVNGTHFSVNCQINIQKPHVDSKYVKISVINVLPRKEIGNVLILTGDGENYKIESTRPLTVEDLDNVPDETIPVAIYNVFLNNEMILTKPIKVNISEIKDSILTQVGNASDNTHSTGNVKVLFEKKPVVIDYGISELSPGLTSDEGSSLLYIPLIIKLEQTVTSEENELMVEIESEKGGVEITTDTFGAKNMLTLINGSPIQYFKVPVVVSGNKTTDLFGKYTIKLKNTYDETMFQNDFVIDEKDVVMHTLSDSVSSKVEYVKENETTYLIKVEYSVDSSNDVLGITKAYTPGDWDIIDEIFQNTDIYILDKTRKTKVNLDDLYTINATCYPLLISLDEQEIEKLPYVVPLETEDYITDFVEVKSTMFVASTIDLLVIMGYLFNSPIDMSIYTWSWMHMYDILYYITTEKPEQIIIPAFRSFNITNGTAELTYVMIVPKDMNKLEEINNQYSGRLVIGTLFADMPGLGMNIGEMQLSVSFENIFSVKRANGCEFDTSLTFNVTNPFDFKGECEIELYEPVDDLGMYFISISPMYPYYYADILLDYYMFMPVSMGYPQEVHG